MKKSLGIVIIAWACCLFSCENQDESTSGKSKTIELNPTSTKQMKSYLSIFEIPALDISRAVKFYNETFGFEIEKMDFPEMQMGLFPYQDQMITGVIVKGEGYVPSANGVAIYFDGGDDLQSILDKVEINGGKIIIPKTPHADESGFFAIFHDSEGNKIGLHSPH